MVNSQDKTRVINLREFYRFHEAFCAKLTALVNGEPNALKPRKKPMKHYRGFPSIDEYYHANDSLHGLTRTQVSQIDPGFYRTSSRHDKIDEFFPEIQTRLTDKQTDYIIAAYPACNGNPYEAAKIVPHQYSTIMNWWAKFNLVTNLPPSSRKKMVLEKLVEPS